MPVSLSKIANNIASVEIPIEDEKVTIVYYPSRVTEKTFAQLQAFSSMSEDTITSRFKTFNEMLAGLIKSWDLYEDEEQTVMYPLEPDRLSELPFVFRIAVIQAIMTDIRPEAAAPQTNSKI